MLATPLVAQTPQGWRMRVDRSQSAEDPDDRPDLHVMTKGKGFQVTGGPAGTFWNPSQTATGNYTAKATFTLIKPSSHTNYYGLIFGGNDLEGGEPGLHLFPRRAERQLHPAQSNGREGDRRAGRDCACRDQAA